MLSQIFLDPQLNAFFQQNPFYVLFMVALTFGALVICLSIHEFAHAYVADRLGDPTAKYLGRVTLNPASHLDPLGTIMLLIAGFGWGRPVPFNPNNLDNPKRDAAIISFAGPASNFILAVIFAVLYHIIPNGGVFEYINLFVELVVFYNLILGFFNLIPVHPLDGFKIVYGLLPSNLAIQWMSLAPYGIFILLILVVTRLTSIIIFPFVNVSLVLLGIG